MTGRLAVEHHPEGNSGDLPFFYGIVNQRVEVAQCSARHARFLSGTPAGELRTAALKGDSCSEHVPEIRGEKVRFALDSPLEGDGFELPVPREMTTILSLRVSGSF